MPVAQAAETDQSEALGQVLATDLLTADLADLGTAYTGYPERPGA